MNEMNTPPLSLKQIEEMGEIAENAVRKYVLSKISLREINDIDFSIDIDGSKPITVNVDLELVLSHPVKNYDVKQLVNEATEEAFSAIEKYLGGLTCKSKKSGRS